MSATRNRVDREIVVLPERFRRFRAEVGRAVPSKTAFLNFSNVVHPPPALNMADMALLPAHPPQTEDDSDDELTDEQVRELLTEASQRMRANPTQSADAPFKLPKLDPGHIADTYSTTQGAITRLDRSKLIPKHQQELANGVKKIEDPLQMLKEKKEVR